MNEELPFIELQMDEETFVATPLNAELFTFTGRTIFENGDVVENSSRNHVFLRRGEQNGEVETGTFVFAPQIVQELGAVMLANGFPARLNQRNINESDEAAYQTYVNQQFDYEEDFDSFPEEWSNGAK